MNHRHNCLGLCVEGVGEDENVDNGRHVHNGSICDGDEGGKGEEGRGGGEVGRTQRVQQKNEIAAENGKHRGELRSTFIASKIRAFN